MWVWIPRYNYDTTNLGTNYAGGTRAQPGEIKVNFVSGTTSSTDDNNYTHPAFTFGEKELTGIWIAKFEMSTFCLDDSKKSSPTCPSVSSEIDKTSNPIIKPNVISWSNLTVKNLFELSQTFSKTGNIYGISTSADSHMIKNTEWGAVAYLSQSRYGKYGNSDYSGANKEIYKNDSSDRYTGRSSGVPPAGRGTANGTYKYNDTEIETSYIKTMVDVIGKYNPKLTNDNTNPWEEIDGVWKSTTQGKNSTTTNLTFDFTLASTSTVSFDWSVSSELASYDYIYYTITKDGTTISGTGDSTKIGGTTYGTTEDAISYTNKSIDLDPGNYKITFTYRKDGSVQKGTDRGYVKNLSILEGVEYTQVVDKQKSGTGASTTGNIYGIYDMSGGAWECVMGNYSNTVSSSGFASTWFNDINNEKYYDKYTSSTACSGYIKGDATYETSGWYSNYASFVYGYWPWFLRGGNYTINNSDASVFDYSSYNGSAINDYASRPSLVH